MGWRARRGLAQAVGPNLQEILFCKSADGGVCVCCSRACVRVRACVWVRARVWSVVCVFELGDALATAVNARMHAIVSIGTRLTNGPITGVGMMSDV